MKRRFKVFAWTMLFCMVYQLVFPAAAYALTGGPSQPEVESFEPVGTSEMVDVFTGDFNYNIPLMEVDGYPINLAYHSGITMDQEASWVGLGWNINPGVMNRNMRGIPDDFNGDEISRVQYMKPNQTFGVGLSKGFEIFGKDLQKNLNIKKFLKKVNGRADLSGNIGINYNNYTGLGIESALTPSLNACQPFKPKLLRRLGLTGSITFASSSKEGFSMRPKFDINTRIVSSSELSITHNTSISTTINSRTGLKSLHFNTGIKAKSLTIKNKDPKNNSFLGAEINGGSTISYVGQTYTPHSDVTMDNISVTLGVKWGSTFWGMNPQAVIGGYFSSQGIKDVKSTQQGYGNIYQHNGTDAKALRDFNREKEGSFSEENPILPIPVHTHDMYSASGQGISGMFIPYRNDIPITADPSVNSISSGYSLDNIEGAWGNLYSFGTDAILNYNSTRTGGWEKDNRLINRIKMTGIVAGAPQYEPTYFKNFGEKTVVDNSTLPYLNIDGGALRPFIESKGNALISGRQSVSSENKLFDDKGQQIDISNSNAVRTSRVKRNVYMGYKTTSERSHSLNKTIKYYNLRNPNNPNTIISAKDAFPVTANFSPSIHKPHHLSEINVVQPGGAKYVYGIPAYNITQYDISFTNAFDPTIGANTDPGTRTVNCATGQISYPGSLNLPQPTLNQIKDRANKGSDHAFNSIHTPAYAHSYLLTDVLSADYVDLSGDGPTRDDHGSYTKISYYKASSNYKWRVPYEANKASYNEKLKSDNTDDEANIIYGEKEIWHVAKIEGKNHYAIFYLSERRDGCGVAGVHGGPSTDNANKAYKLDKIELYANNQGNDNTPIQTVHFRYDYTLCPQTDNSVYHSTENPNRGKLTLKEVYFTYGTSQKGRLNSYRFNYNNLNPSYNLKGYDRWGNYKPNPVITETGIDCSQLSSAEFPYVTQDKTLADQYASAWHLSSIDLPSGGSINISYEADDYAYVQDKQAMQMAKIRGFTDYDNSLFEPSTSISSIDAGGTLYNEDNPHECILFDLPASTLALSPEAIKQNLLSNQDNILYYNCLVNLTNATEPNYEYIRGYTTIEDAGVINMQGTHPVGWIKVGLKDGNQHPISRSAWQFAGMYLPYLVNPGSNLKKDLSVQNASLAVAKGLLGFLFEAADMIEGVYNKLRRKNFGKEVNLNKSWIRINNLTGYKYGGGSRVKRLTMNNNWNALSGSGITENYGQEYEYKTLAYYNGKEQVISSGVAAYEPQLGGDENVWKRPVAYEIDNIGVPNEEFYSEEPFGESYFPAASVGYSRVSVKSITPADVNANNHGTGKVVHQYYTAKDFPVIPTRTDLYSRTYETSALFTILGLNSNTDMTTAQGYQIELNDMHGKPKSTLNYAQSKIDSYNDAEAFSGIKYTYKTEADNPAKLNNTTAVVNRNNQVYPALVGVESQMVLDTRKMESESYSGSLDFNFSLFYSPPGPITPITAVIFTFSIIPGFNAEFISYKSDVLVRVINRTGLLVKTEAFEEGSSVATENVLLDAETGEVLLTKTYNEYKDPLYNFTMPAHWVYDGMGGAYQNEGLTIDVVANPTNYSAFVVGSGNTEDYFSDGDEIRITNYAYANPNERYFVNKVTKNGVTSWYVLKDNGHRLIIDGPATFKIMKSGRKNMQTVPVMAVSSMNNPVSGTALSFNAGTNVLNAAATTFSDNWRMPSEFTKNCDYDVYKEEVVAILNYLLQSGQLTAANYNNYIETDATYHPNTIPLTISTTASGHEAYTSTRIKAQYDACSALGRVHTTSPRFTNTTGYFGIVFVIPGTCDIISSNFYLSGNINDLLGFTDTNPNNQIMPTSIELLENIYDQLSNVRVNYIDANGNPQSRIAQGIFENPRLNATTCDCHERTKHTVNIYKEGIKGQWRKQKDWVYYGERKKPTVTNLRKDGAYQTFASYWKQPSMGEKYWSANTTANDANAANWTWTNEVTKYNREGQELENRNPLNIYSAAIYSNRLKNAPLAVAANAGYNQIGVENLEDNYNVDNACPNSNLGFNLQFTSWVTTEHHTGKFSMMLNNTAPAVQAQYPIITDDGVYDNGPNNTKVDQNYLNGLFNPKPGKYVIGGWVKVSNKPKAASYYENANSARITVEITGGGTTTVNCYPKGQIIDGWQRVEGTFTVTANTTSVKFTLNKDAANNTYFDDLRVHPFDAQLKTYVYDYNTNRVTAELDENNYATLYEYNAEGQLIRVKKETEKGIVTLKEVRGNQHKITPTN